MLKVTLMLVMSMALVGSMNTDDLRNVIKVGHYKFGLNLIRELRKSVGSEENFYVSPANVYAGLAVVLYPSNGQTKEQLLDIMGLPSTYERDELHKTLGQIFQNGGNQQNGSMTISQGVFVHKDFQIKDSFRTSVRDLYRGDVNNVDFKSQGEAKEWINNWIRDHTGGEICQIDYPKDTYLVLANALYLNARWQQRFQKTRMSEFFTDKNLAPIYNGRWNGRRISNGNVESMIGTGRVQYYENDNLRYKTIGLPCEDKDCTMYFVLPNEDQTVDAVLEGISSDHIDSIVNSREEEVSFKIPKLELKLKTNLGDQIRGLGAEDLFTEKADFSDLADRVRLGDVTHQVHVSWDEQGTTHSTVITKEVKSNSGIRKRMPMNDIENMMEINDAGTGKQFNIDKPFIFFMHHKNSQLVPFFGCFRKPSNL